MENTTNTENITNARTSFAGKRLTESAYADVEAITGIIDREIVKSGKFQEKLTDYAHAYARTARIDASKAEITIRDIYKAQYGHSMNDRRKQLMSNEERLTDIQRQSALQPAQKVGESIRSGIKVPFYIALDTQATKFSNQLDITENKAKVLMAEAFEQSTGQKFYDHCKALEKQFYTPQIEEEKAQHTESRTQKSSKLEHSQGYN